MGRWLFNLAAGASLLVALLICIFWIRSRWSSDSLRYHATNPATHRLDAYLISEAGGMTLGRKIFYWPPEAQTAAMTLVNRTRRAYTWQFDSRPVPPAGVLYMRLGFNWFSAIDLKMVPGATSKEARLFIPYWALLLATLITPIAWILHRRRQRNAQPGICKICGYDLRATPDRCPECGAVPDYSTESSAPVTK